jgi:thymidylate synthase (FAD)
MLQVKLLSKTENPIPLIYAAFRQCYSPHSIPQLWETFLSDNKDVQEDFIKKLIQTSHHSPIEHVSFTFAVTGYSRISSQQLTRHRIASFSQRSQRYVNENNFTFITPPSIKKNSKAEKIFLNFMEQARETYQKLVAAGIPEEDARFVLPNATETQLIFTMNCRELIHFLGLRLCERAQWETRNLARQVHEILKQELPAIFKAVGPQCKNLGYCPENQFSCGKYPTKKELLTHAQSLLQQT